LGGQNENVSTCILGASKPEQVADNCKALKVLPKLTPEVMEKIEKVLENKPAQPVSPRDTTALVEYMRREVSGRLMLDLNLDTCLSTGPVRTRDLHFLSVVMPERVGFLL
jgi:hypothetical protein